MKTIDWKRSNRVDSALHVVLFVIAMAVLGASAFETHVDTVHTAQIEASANMT